MTTTTYTITVHTAGPESPAAMRITAKTVQEAETIYGDLVSAHPDQFVTVAETGGNCKVTAFRSGERYPAAVLEDQDEAKALAVAERLATLPEFMLVTVSQPARIGHVLLAQWLEGRRVNL